MKSKEHFKRRIMEFLLKSWSGDQNIYINLRGGDENSIKYVRMSSTPSPQVINDPSLTRRCPMVESQFILGLLFPEEGNIVREQPPRMCNNNPKINCDSTIGQRLITNPECAKTYTGDNFRIIGQARSSFHLIVLKSVYIKTQNPVLCKQK